MDPVSELFQGDGFKRDFWHNHFSRLSSKWRIVRWNVEESLHQKFSKTYQSDSQWVWRWIVAIVAVEGKVGSIEEYNVQNDTWTVKEETLDEISEEEGFIMMKFYFDSE